jgi:hypothetical protein
MSLGADTVFFLSFVGDCARIAGFSMKWLSRDIMTIPTDQLAKKSPRHSSSTDYYSKVGLWQGFSGPSHGPWRITGILPRA